MKKKFNIKAKLIGLALDFEGARYANFTNVATWTPNNSNAQKFSLVKI